MIIFPAMRWEVVNIFLICSLIIVSGKSIYDDNKRDEGLRENDSNLYFNGAEEPQSDVNPIKISEAELPQDGELFEGDMVMDTRLRRAVLGEEDKKAAIYDSEILNSKHWPNNIIPYVIHDSLAKSISVQIPMAIKIFKHFTCVLFVPKSETHVDYIKFQDGKGCSSSVGRLGGEQTVHLGIGCRRIGTVLHEMMHVLGIIHEQSRPDRDQYLVVKFDNIERELYPNFLKYKFYQADTLNTPYNYNSVMHYSNYAFSKNEKKTLVSKFDEGLEFGQRHMLSRLDVTEINTLYPCRKKFSRGDLLYEDMTSRIILQKKRDETKYIWKGIVEQYL